jgi:ATP-dependent Lhr-like helicase
MQKKREASDNMGGMGDQSTQGGASAVEMFHPVIQSWFTQTFGEPTDVQVQAWAAIAAGRHTLIAAPTGSGKTLAALLPCLDRAVREKAAAGPSLASGVRILYVTPLKALNNDIHAHVVGFAEAMERYAKEEPTAAGGRDGHGQESAEGGLVGTSVHGASDAQNGPVGHGQEAEWPGLTAMVRTGDTAQSTRASMLRRPPDLLVTTPESLYLMLTSHKARAILQTVHSVIVDEIHDLAADERGVHLSVSLERLTELCGITPQRIGVSATQKPLERVARFLGGWEERNEAAEAADEASAAATALAALTDAERSHYAGDGLQLLPRPVTIIESRMEKTFDVLVTMPDFGLSLGPTKRDVWTPIVERLLQLMEGARSVLVFTNSRRLTERLTLRLNDHVGYELARAHHGSVSREKRLEVERLLKTGSLRCIVATSSLELGIDVGHVDLVLQIDSPKSAAAGIQRIGRAGHAAGAVSRGVIVCRSRVDLAEAAVLARAVAAREIEEIRIPRHLLGVLSQQVVAMTATEDWDIGRLHRVLAQSDCFRGYPRARLEAALQVLAGLYPFAKPLIAWDREAGVLTRTSAGSMAALVGAGTIPQSSAYPVHHADTRVHLGELDETYVHESRVGDVFQLGTNSWMIQAIRPDRIYVTERHNAVSEVPFWQAEALGRSVQLGRAVGALLRELDDGLSTLDLLPLQERIMREYHLDARAADQLLGLVRSQKAVSAVPTDRRIVVELYKDDAGHHHLLVHCVFGKRFNRTWMLALQPELEQLTGGRVYAVAKDNGIEFVLTDWEPSWLGALRRVTPARLEQRLGETVPGAPMLGAAFRRIAETSLLLSRGLTRVPMWKKRYRSEELLKEALPFADRFPYLREALQQCMHEELDVTEVGQVLEALDNGQMEWTVVRGTAPSPLAVQYLNDFVNTAIYESDALGKDVRERLMGVSRELAAEWFGADNGQYRPSIHPQVLQDEQRQPEAFQAAAEGDVLRTLKRYGDLTGAELEQRLGAASDEQHLTILGWLKQLKADGKIVTVHYEEEARWICSEEADWYDRLPHDRDAAAFIWGRYVEHQLAVTPESIADRYKTDRQTANRFISDWVEAGRLVKAPYAAADEPDVWMHERLAARMIRRSVKLYQEETERTTPARLSRYLAELHALIGPDRTNGPDGVRKALLRLEGQFLPWAVWETIVLPGRVPGYRKEDLDLLLASGEFFWIGRGEEPGKEGKIAFFRPDSYELFTPFAGQTQPTRHPALLDALKRRGAVFLGTLARELGVQPSVLLAQLLELVWEGNAANDQFAPIRQQAARPSRGPGAFQSGLGRWYATDGLLTTAVDPEQSAVRWAGRLLEQYVIVTKEQVKDTPFSWDTMTSVFRRLEEWGMATRGFLVRGATSLQFVSRDAAERLKELPQGQPQEPILVSAIDPANPFGLSVPWPEVPGVTFARSPRHYLVLLPQPNAFLWLENGGRRWTLLTEDGQPQPETEAPPLTSQQLNVMLRALWRAGSQRKLTIELWNGKPVAGSPLGIALEAVGAEREAQRYVVWPSALKL